MWDFRYFRKKLNNVAGEKPKMQCRVRYQLPQKFDFRVWFPMHMSVQLKRMIGKLRTMDLIIEVGAYLRAERDVSDRLTIIHLFLLIDFIL